MSTSGKTLHLILALSLFLSGACAAADANMQKLIDLNIPNIVSNNIKQGTFLFTGEKILLDPDHLQGWFITTVRGGTNIWDDYEKNYKNKETVVPAVDMPKLDYDDLSVYNMIIQSCGGWTGKIYELYNYSLQDVNRVPVIDVTCNRLFNPEKIRAYDVIFMINQKKDFTQGDASHLELNKELKNIKGIDSKSYDSYIFRNARYVEPTIERTDSINDFLLVQLAAKRYMPRGGFLEIFEYGKMRDKDTYILVLTGQRVKLIVQTFYYKGTKPQELEKELESILNSITIKR
jgi:hypothetical protein